MFENRLQKIREAHGLTVRQTADALQLPYTTYNNYEKNSREPNGQLLCSIADFFGVSIDYLLGRSAENPKQHVLPTKEERLIAEQWNKLDAHGKKIVSIVLEAEYQRCTEQKTERQIPMITIRSSSYQVSAGTGFFLDEGDSWEEIQVPDSPEARKADYALTINGDSMEPIYHNGDIVLVKQTEAVQFGEIGIFIVDGNGYIKKFGGDRLISLNDAYADILLKHDSYVRCCGKVIGRV
ncbi:MAG: helix-turn-helix domain-containing protein [Ruminococcus sp.]